jgi:predicted amidophosphoribosyltransferase
VDAPRRFCAVCGLEVAGTRCANWWCRRDDRGFSAVWSVAGHDHHLRDAIARYKYRGVTDTARFLATTLLGFLETRALWFEEYEVLVGVPAYTGRGARRSWDHLGLILESLAQQAGPLWPVATGVVVKTAETPAMTSLGLAARRRCAAGPLRRALNVPAVATVAGARILVVDDVFTEGSTLREVALALLDAGAAEVGGLCLARQHWRVRS